MQDFFFSRLFRLLAAISIAAVGLFWAPPAQAADCQFILGFAALHSAIPNIVGPCVTNEQYDAQGNAFQPTDHGQLIWHRADNWTGFTNGYVVWVNGSNGIQKRLATQRFSWESNALGLPMVVDAAGQSATTYLDDRSNEYALLESWANALNRREYVRAYSYWDPNATQLAPFAQFQAGYAGMASVNLSIGIVSEEPAAGNRYAMVPVVLVAQTISDGMQTFTGCYQLHEAVPAIQDTPPFQPWAIQSATVWQVANTADQASLLASACSAPAGTALASQPLSDPNDVSLARYLDDRSTAEELIRSLINALNRHEYLRAYSYWDPKASGLPAYATFKQGYQTTDSVELTLGTVTADAGAGQRNFKLPVLLRSHLTDGTTQAFTGCYQLHLSEPSIQGIPPFMPLAIQSANIQLAAANAALPSCP